MRRNAGVHAAEGKLKDLITGQDHLIEFKGKEPIKVRNYVRLFVTGNPDWLVPAGFEERRFAVLEIGEAHMQDKAYFAAIDEQMDNGGREALRARRALAPYWRRCRWQQRPRRRQKVSSHPARPQEERQG